MTKPFIDLPRRTPFLCHLGVHKWKTWVSRGAYLDVCKRCHKRRHRALG